MMLPNIDLLDILKACAAIDAHHGHTWWCVREAMRMHGTVRSRTDEPFEYNMVPYSCKRTLGCYSHFILLEMIRIFWWKLFSCARWSISHTLTVK